MTTAVMTRDKDWRNWESFSEMPTCKTLAVMVIMAAVWPGGKASSVEIGCRKRHLMYSSLTAADMRKLAIRKPN